MMKTTWRTTAVLGLAAALLCPFALGKIGETGARYRSAGQGSTAVRVASLSIDVSDPVLLSEDEILDCNLESDEIAYELEIKNRSEVDMRYTVATSGCGNNINAEIVPAAGELGAGGDSATVTVRLRVIDRRRRDQPESLDAFTITVTGEQKGENE